MRALCLVLVLGCIPATASAVTVQDIVALTKAGVPDTVLTAVIDADRTMFTLSPEEIIRLRKAGVSDRVLLKMIGSRREFAPPEPEPLPPSEQQPTEVVVVGSAPDSPLTQQTTIVPYPAPYYVGVPIFGGQPSHGRPHSGQGHTRPHDVPAEVTNFGPVAGSGWAASTRQPPPDRVPPPPARGSNVFGRFMNDPTTRQP